MYLSHEGFFRQSHARLSGQSVGIKYQNEAEGPKPLHGFHYAPGEP